MKLIELVNKYYHNEITNKWNELFDSKVDNDHIQSFIETVNKTDLVDTGGKIKVDNHDDLGIYNVTYITDDNYSLSFIAWGKLLNAKIIGNAKLDLIALVNILYDMSWYGWTEEMVQTQYKKLQQQIEAIENGEVKTYTLDDVLDKLERK